MQDFRKLIVDLRNHHKSYINRAKVFLSMLTPEMQESRQVSLREYFQGECIRTVKKCFKPLLPKGEKAEENLWISFPKVGTISIAYTFSNEIDDYTDIDIKLSNKIRMNRVLRKLQKFHKKIISQDSPIIRAQET